VGQATVAQQIERNSVGVTDLFFGVLAGARGAGDHRSGGGGVRVGAAAGDGGGGWLGRGPALPLGLQLALRLRVTRTSPATAPGPFELTRPRRSPVTRGCAKAPELTRARLCVTRTGLLNRVLGIETRTRFVV
jgi:hypothetical protein